ncbi:cardiolipin synthase ClsB [Achromobacter aloeverae]|uniref:Cardiolipin synthase B n=1 Tax=Achromobacter aloeverae TaxID=1750518 RepID=A0A4Q1HTC8_9BURK|nr:cardiolipin synthase ClsB [Achromobacter aloeverae]RXN93115.1 cardiolipin synthase ClsB [Achromobacter aloeverae]
MSIRWIPGNAFTLLENGEAFYPRVFEAIDQARVEVLVETFILADDKVGQGLREALIGAARRGVRVNLLVDGYGSEGLSDAFIGGMTDVGVVIQAFDPRARVFGLRTNVFRRMHRKLVVIDGERAFIGGINFSADHLGDFGPQAKQDYAVEARGPIVGEMHRFALRALEPPRRRHWWSRRSRAAENPPRVGSAEAMLVVRDNHRHHTDIERHYRAAIRLARRDVVIANAYFFPGYRLLRELRNAARRGVRVRLILQGEPDMPIAKLAAGMLYDYLTAAGVQIHEYCERPLHGKVATVDDTWATVGSSNLDPLSLALNLEANVMIRDQEFAGVLNERLEWLVAHHCRQPEPAPPGSRKLRRLFFGVFVYHFLRRFPAWTGWLPAHRPRLQPWRPKGQVIPTDTESSAAPDDPPGGQEVARPGTAPTPENDASAEGGQHARHTA